MTSRFKVSLVCGSLACVGLVALLPACKQNAPVAQLRDDASATATPGTRATTAWIAKAGRVLRNQSVVDDDEIDRLSGKSESEVVDEFMKDPLFQDMILSFNLFYLGRSVTNLTVEEGGTKAYDSSIYGIPNALAAARAAFTGGDYLGQLWSLSPTLLLPPATAPQAFEEARRAGPPPGGSGSAAPDTSGPSETSGVMGLKLAGDDVVAKNKAQILKEIDAVTGDTLAAKVTDPAGGFSPWCEAMSGLGSRISEALASTGFASNYGAAISRLWVGFDHEILSAAQQGCGKEGGIPDAALVAAKDYLKKVRTGVVAIFAKRDDIKAATGGTIALAEYEAKPAEGLPALNDIFTEDAFWRALPSTYSNKNRKRAAYALRTFFCEEIVPVEVGSLPASHAAGDRHASEGACRSCHYKLDPMGALFRFRGKNGRDFTGTGKLEFDDGNPLEGAELRKHLETWERGGKLQAGYYVDFDKMHTDFRGDTLEDLFRFLPTAEEARLCVTRRLTEFVLGTNQVYDGGFLDSLNKDLEVGADSGKAFRKVVKRLIMSKTFRERDPAAGQCYDIYEKQGERYVEAPANASRPPCEVAHIFRTRCAACHRNKDLKFHIWEPVAGDAERRSWFSHDGTSIKDSAKLIAERLIDTRAPMPPNRTGELLPLKLRDPLLRWLKRFDP